MLVSFNFVLFSFFETMDAPAKVKNIDINRLYVVRVFCEKRHVQRSIDNRNIFEVIILDDTTGTVA